MMQTYNLKKSDVFNHESIQRKRRGEGQVVYDAIENILLDKANAATQYNSVTSPVPAASKDIQLKGFYEN
ncbi:hypothetical protein [Chryseolinea lacunae]|uniref:Uncharacterized protein n=1 Tax=Chryseolinea lacunae TaxID=2801331 RepID=A0ABS1L2K6_9BACT|nr:hypothetical protein [Chryseolinea lacunae]MBL0745951.1 hypothetical protein [Chryseolinea lacunae]